MMLIFNTAIIFVAAMCFGSFITMASYRLAVFQQRKNDGEKTNVKNLIFDRSFCPNCNKTLKFRHLLPIISWLFYQGKCGLCLQKISTRYLLIEIFNVVLFLTIFFVLGAKIDLRLILTLLIVVVLMIIAIVDLEHYFIPNIAQIVLTFLVLIYHVFIVEKYDLPHYFLSAIYFLTAAIILHYGFLFITKKRGIGEDDIKFFFVAGFFLGINQLMAFMIINGIFGVVFGLIWTKMKNDNTFPFAPALVAAFLIPNLFNIEYIEWLGFLLYWFQKYINITIF